jgi:protein-tyrosine phosphatase
MRYLLESEAPDLRVEVDSAGTGNYHIGAPPDERAQAAARSRGIDLSGLRARQVQVSDFRRFDLILAMDRQNIRALQLIEPKDSSPSAEIRLFLAYARGSGEREVPDPYTGSAGDFEHVLDLVTDAARGLIARLQERAQ